MATNILSAHAYTTQEVVYSSEIASAQNVDIAAKVTGTGAGQIKYTIQRKTANTDWRTAKDENGAPLEFATVGATTEGLNIAGLNAALLRVKVEVISGAGTINIEYESL